MSASPTSERVYAGLKHRILDRQYRPGDRLDPASFGDALGSSVTPVRDALHRLLGERLVEARASEGFYLPRIDLAGLGDLYSWARDIAIVALRSWRPGLQDPASAMTSGDGSDNAIVHATAAAFAAIGQRSTNLEHRAAIASVNDRLHAVRLAEVRVFAGIGEEVDALGAAVATGSVQVLRQQITAYHRRRHRHCDEIVWTLYRNGTAR